MSWWNAKYKNNYGEYEITFASKHYEKAKSVEKVCCAVMDKAIKSPLDVEVVVRCRECKHCDPENYHCDHAMSTSDPLRRKPDDFCSYGERLGGADNG